MNERDTQPYKFVLYMKDGSRITGGAESKELCIAHLRHCLLPPDGNDIESAWYLGRYGNGIPKEVTQ